MPFPRRPMVLVFTLALGLVACSKRSPPVPWVTDASPAAVVDAAPVAPKRTAAEIAADYRDTSFAIANLNPRWCRVKAAEEKWEKAHDEGRSYAAAIGALRAVEKEAREQASKADVPAEASCAREVRGEYLGAISATPKLAADAIACLERHRADIEAKLRKGGTFGDAAPAECLFSVPLFKSSLECTKAVAACAGSPCAWYEIASHLGVACDPKENASAPALRSR